MDTETQVQILDEAAVYILPSTTNTLEKSINPTIFPPAKGN